LAGRGDEGQKWVSMSTKTGQQSTRQSFIWDRVGTVKKVRAVMTIHLVTETEGGTDHSIHSTKPNEQLTQLAGGYDYIAV